MDTSTREEAIVLANLIDEMDYYQVLRVEPKVPLEQIRKAYHQQSKHFHPDRYYQLEDPEFKECIFKIAKRITEAYTALRDVQKRRSYDQQLEKTQHMNLRLTDEAVQEQKKVQEEQIGKTDKGRKIYQQGLQELNRKNYAAAERAFKMGLAYEPDNALFKKMMEEAARNIKTDYKIK